MTEPATVSESAPAPTTRPPGRPAGGRRVIERDAVLDNAEIAIRREGSSTTIEAIARESGVTKPIVYARVGDRSALAEALSERLIKRLVAATGAAIAAAPPGRPGLVAWIRSTLETVADHRELFLYVTGGTENDTPERRLRLASLSSVPLAALFERWRVDNELDPSVAVPWAYGVTGMLNFVTLWWLDDTERSPDVVAEQMAELLWAGISGTGD